MFAYWLIKKRTVYQMPSKTVRFRKKIAIYEFEKLCAEKQYKRFVLDSKLQICKPFSTTPPPIRYHKEYSQIKILSFGLIGYLIQFGDNNDNIVLDFVSYATAPTENDTDINGDRFVFFCENYQYTPNGRDCVRRYAPVVIIAHTD